MSKKGKVILINHESDFNQAGVFNSKNIVLDQRKSIDYNYIKTNMLTKLNLVRTDPLRTITDILFKNKCPKCKGMMVEETVLVGVMGGDSLSKYQYRCLECGYICTKKED